MSLSYVLRSASAPDMKLGHWVTGSIGHLSRPGHRVIILTRCENRVFPVFEKNDLKNFTLQKRANAKRR